MNAARQGPAGLLGDQRGQTTLEWTLLLAAAVLPMAWIFKYLLEMLAEHYRMVVFLESLPLP
jgi:hypothetical protein